MITIEKTQEMLDDIAMSLPPEIYKELNGGILLLPEAKCSPYARNNDLWIMGQYCVNPSMGRFIEIYYGSFARMYSHMDEEFWYSKLREVLLHEFTHHLEGLAGERDLEEWDEQQLMKYLGTE